VRLATPAQRKALAARDGGCVIPGCGVPPAGCEAHHLRAWADGGPTDLDNQALVCACHHDAVHAGVWRLVMTGGVPRVIPPAWVDPARRALRNPVHDGRRQADALGEQLRLTINGAIDGPFAHDPQSSGDPPEPPDDG